MVQFDKKKCQFDRQNTLDYIDFGFDFVWTSGGNDGN